VITLKASEIARITGGVLHGDANIVVTGSVEVDSRKCGKGSLFLALKGENVDGHDFVTDASKHGAVLSLTDRQISQPCIVVPDVVVALGKLAQHVREELSDLMVIGITGSQGKTTTKDLLSHLLQIIGKTVAPAGSFNNEIGAPLTILQCDESTTFCIVEMGARHSGDIAKLCEIAQPAIGVVLKVGTAHVGEFGDRETIARTKGELIASLPSHGTAVLGSYDEFTPQMAKGLDLDVITFGPGHDCDVRATDVEIREGRPHFDLVTPAGRTTVGLRLIGAHQVANALAVASVGHALGISLDVIAGSLSTAEPSSKWRMELHELSDLLIINDSYNANPDSMAAALQTLALFAQERGGSAWAFLSTMHELGESEAREHQMIGQVCVDLDIDHVVCVAEPRYEIKSSTTTKFHQALDKAQALTFMTHVEPGDVILLKASRAEALNELVAPMTAQWNEREVAHD